MNFVNNIVVLDLEATGTWVEKDKIIEIAMIKCLANGSRQTFQKKVNPGIPIPRVVIDLTGISDDDVKSCPFFKDIASEIIEFLSNCDFAGFNIERFDLPLLEREMFEVGQKLEWQKRNIYDSQKIYHLNEKRDLTAAYKFYCNKELNNAHSALADTEATLEILQAQAIKYGEGKSLESLGRFNYQSKSEYYDADRKFRWWNGKLYMMFGKYARQYSLQDLVKKDRGYLDWIVSADFSDEVKELVQNALNGKFPTFESKEQRELFNKM